MAVESRDQFSLSRRRITLATAVGPITVIHSGPFLIDKQLGVLYVKFFAGYIRGVLLFHAFVFSVTFVSGSVSVPRGYLS